VAPAKASASTDFLEWFECAVGLLLAFAALIYIVCLPGTLIVFMCDFQCREQADVPLTTSDALRISFARSVIAEYTLGCALQPSPQKNLARDRLCATMITDAGFELRLINKASPFET
jgi:hypothetical protein